MSHLAAGLAALALATASAVAAPASAANLEASVKDDKGKPVENAVVYLMTAPGATAQAVSSTRAVMDQQDKEFIPHVLPVLVGTAVNFPNNDNIRHHVYSVSPAKRFELPLYTGTPAQPVVFDKPGVVALGCNIHDWMVAYVFVLPTPWFARSAGDGIARLADVPPGAYEVRVWHPRLREATEKTGQPVTLRAPEPARVEFGISLKREWRIPRGAGRYDPNVGN